MTMAFWSENYIDSMGIDADGGDILDIVGHLRECSTSP